MTRSVVLVTGAQGIGKAICHTLLQRGHHVCAYDVDAESCNELVTQYAPQVEEQRLLVIRGDVRDEQAVSSAVQRCVEQLGGLTGLVNNAARANPHYPPIEALSLDRWQECVDINLTGPFLMAKHAAPALRRAKGSIVNLASTRALQSEPNGEVYAATKGAMISFTHALAVSLAPQVRVNCISPGWIDTSAWHKSSRPAFPTPTEADLGQHPVGRLGRPEDVAGLVAYLLSDEAGFITGQNIVIDGGMSKKMIYVDR
jgi:NAD(P)-dependent dehydrogenase (short-subunit alcohol dehydrogenase family)